MGTEAVSGLPEPLELVGPRWMRCGLAAALTVAGVLTTLWLLLTGTGAPLLADLAALAIGLGGVACAGCVRRTAGRRLVERQAAASRSARAQRLVTGLALRALADVDGSQLDAEAAALLRGALGTEAVTIRRPAPSDQGAEGGVRDGDPLRAEIGHAGRRFGVVEARLGRSAHPEEAMLAAGVADLLALATVRAEAERARRDEAGSDRLTGLPGRERFAELLDARLPTGGTLLLVDVDDFGLVNETLGPRAGDVLLRSIAARLRTALPRSSALARVGGDELAVFAPGLHAEPAALDLVDALQRELTAPFDLSGTRHHVSVCVGIVLCRRDAYRDHRGAIRDAHVAVRRAKEAGRGRRELFNAQVRAGLEHRRRLEQELRAGLKRREFHLVYQPVVDLETGAITGAEALVRWQHPERGALAPGAFIEVAEASDVIVPLGSWILREAMRQLKAWDESIDGLGPFRLGINLSGRQLADPDFVPQVRRLLHAFEMEPARILFELTETAFVHESPQVDRAVHDLRRLGVALALDDFGTGYASLSYVRRFAFDALKLDRSFVAGLQQRSEDRALVTAAISLGHALNMKVVAEGVETPGQAERLRALGCTTAQGFLYSRPVPPAELRALLMRGRAGGSLVPGDSALT